ncbi:MAG: tetratricopeptide repeat protein [Desulfobacterales bacterium]|nr:tetratricopeptide repeat protein [Desulfobacterales bacterium]
MNTHATPFHLRHGDLFWGAALVVLVFSAYWGVADHAFVNYDDPLYVTKNPHLIKGFSIDGILWAFSTLYANFWHPLTWLSYLFDFELFGMHPGGYLFTNLMLHLFSTLILFATLRRMTGALWRSGLVAALFALHPLNVESVAWVAERKNVLSTFFWMLTVWGYCRYAQQPGRGRFVLVLVFFVLGLMAKPMLVTLPFVLLLIDYWPLGRLSPFQASEGNGRSLAGISLVPFFSLAIEKLPFLLIAAVFSVIAYVAQDVGGALPSLETFPLPVRAANALVSYSVYLRKMVWPVDLTVFYPHPGMPPWGKVGGSMLVFVLVTFFSVKQVRSRPWFIVGWLWYLGTLVPVIGLVQIGSFAMADRFAYIPLIGVFIMLGWNTAGESGGRWKQWGLVLCWAMVLVVMAGMTRQQVRYWQNSTTLFRHALAVAGNHFVIHKYLGAALAEDGDPAAAAWHYREVLRLEPDNGGNHYNLGVVLAEKGDTVAAVWHYREALRLKADKEGEIHSNLGALLINQGALAEAAAHLHEAIRIDPSLKKAHNNLANLYARQGRLDLAVDSYRRALEIDPLMATACNNLGVALARQGKSEAAVVQFKRALKLRPGNGSALKNLARYSKVCNRDREDQLHVRQ